MRRSQKLEKKKGTILSDSPFPKEVGNCFLLGERLRDAGEHLFAADEAERAVDLRRAVRFFSNGRHQCRFFLWEKTLAILRAPAIML